jgi:hypothetical protein
LRVGTLSRVGEVEDRQDPTWGKPSRINDVVKEVVNSLMGDN